ncbi:MAG: hypothetical protein SFX73_17100 [Kofleriaceae bacterium]|nr:hypothetical protein [Kofleriaceae bacterium]
MADIIDFLPYSRPPRIDALAGFALAVELLRVAPPRPSKAIAEALAEVRAAAQALDLESQARARTRPQSLKPLDMRFDGAWTALRDRLVSYSRLLSPEAAEERNRAEQLLAAYFPDGVQFVLLAYEAEWAASHQRITRWTKDGARADLASLAGERFVREVENAHQTLGEALNLSGALKAAKTPTQVGQKVQALAEAIGDYTRKLSGTVERSDPKSVAAFRRAMEPLDAYRASGEARGGAEGELPDAPVADEPATDDPRTDEPRTDDPPPAPVRPGFRGGDPFLPETPLKK